MNPLTFFGSLLEPGTDWEKALVEQGEAAVHAGLRKLMHGRLFDAKPGKKSQVQQIAAKMQAEGWTWESTDSRVTGTPDEGLGRGFVIARDAIYRLIKALGVPGGGVRDALRDAVDNSLWARISANCPVGTSLDSVVAQTAEELINLYLGHAA
jgi:hypothetical protein